MAHKVKLDSVDRQILHDLQDNGRITNVDLAKSAGISAPPVCGVCGCWKKLVLSKAIKLILTRMRWASASRFLPLLV